MLQNKKPLVTIITTVYNDAKNLECTIQSILTQTYKNLEYIIIDGGSTDGTVGIIKKYEDKLAYWVSEEDKGISDAFNKGVKKSKGDYINFQGAGDHFLLDDVIEKMMEDVNIENDWLLCGRIERVSQKGDILFSTGTNFTKRSLLFRMSLPHQALFTNKKFFADYGLFDVDNKFCMDYELLLRAYKKFPKVVMKDIFVSAWRDGGIGAERTIKVYEEYLKIKIKNKVAPTWVLRLIFYWSIFKYYVKKIFFKKLK